MDNIELQHWGIKGMKWGIRRKRPSGESSSDYDKAHDKKHVSEMSDKELQDRLNRLRNEQQYKELTKKTNYAAKALKAFIATAGTIAAISGACEKYKKAGQQVMNSKTTQKAIDKVGDYVVKNMNLSGSLTEDSK